MTKRVYIEDGMVTVEINGEKHRYETFVAAAAILGDASYEGAEKIAAAVEANGQYEVA